MRRPIANLSNIIAVLVVVMLAAACLSPVAWSQDSQAALKPMAPRVDPNAERAKKSKPLQGNVQHTEDLATPKPKPMRANVGGGGFLGRLRGENRAANSDPLRARANNNGLNAQATSGFGIIGVRFVLTVGRPPIINRVFAGTPAAEVGLLPNDAIVAVDGVPTFGLTKEEVYDLIIGSPGTSVNVSIQRGGDFRVVTCTRMDINDITDPIVRRDYMLSM